MKKLLLLLPLFLGSAFSPAVASIYADLEARTVKGTKDGMPLVVISDGNTSVMTNSPKAKIPAGTGSLSEGESTTVPMNSAGFEYYSNLFNELNVFHGEEEDFAGLGVDEGWKCSSRFPSQAAQCVTSVSTRKCSQIQTQYIRTKDYPVDGERRVSQWLRYLRPGLSSPDRLYCEESNLVIGCRAGRCYGSPSSGEYGFYPGKWNTISIDGRKWGFEGGPSRQQELEIWKAIKDGSRFAYQLVHWPYESLVTGSETLSLPKGLKDKIYRMSLEKP